MKRFNAYRVELVVVVLMIDEVDQVLIRRGDRDVVGRLVAAAAAEVKCGVVVEETMVV
jgi:hypothetical protein